MLRFIYQLQELDRQIMAGQPGSPNHVLPQEIAGLIKDLWKPSGFP